MATEMDNGNHLALLLIFKVQVKHENISMLTKLYNLSKIFIENCTLVIEQNQINEFNKFFSK